MRSPPARPDGGRWRYRGPGVLKGDRLGAASPHRPALDPETALGLAREAAARIRSGAVAIEAWPGGAQPPEGGGEIIFVMRGKARFRFGPHAEFLSEAEAGDTVFVPAGTAWRLGNAAPGRPLDCIRIDPDGEAQVIEVDQAPSSSDEEVLWVDPVR